jgi:hypothetical protein
MHLTTETTARRPTGVLTRMSAWIGRRQRELSDRVHAAGDERARSYGWEVIENTGRLGFGGRTYRDPRLDGRQRQLSHGAAQVTGRDRTQVGPGVNRPACGPDVAPDVSPDREAVLAEWPGAPWAETGPGEDQITDWNEATDYEPSKETGE